MTSSFYCKITSKIEIIINMELLQQPTKGRARLCALKLSLACILLLILSSLPGHNCQRDPRKIVPMDQYRQFSRILDCSQCFQAGGRMCHHKNHSSMFYTTYSSNSGNGICCKSRVPKSGYCSGNDGTHICSMPSHDTDPDSQYKDVLSEDERNY